MTTRRRIARDAAIAAAFEGKAFEIIAEIKLPATDVKFAAFVTGARGRNGYAIREIGSTIVRVTGWQTVMDAADLGAIEMTRSADGTYIKPIVPVQTEMPGSSPVSGSEVETDNSPIEVEMTQIEAPVTMMDMVDIED